MESVFQIGSLGYVAGVILLLSSVPPLLEQIRSSDPKSRADRGSHLLIASGNMLWVPVGLGSETYSIAIMCGVNAALRLMTWWRLECNRRKSLRPEPPRLLDSWSP